MESFKSKSSVLGNSILENFELENVKLKSCVGRFHMERCYVGELRWRVMLIERILHGDFLAMGSRYILVT